MAQVEQHPSDAHAPRHAAVRDDRRAARYSFCAAARELEQQGFEEALDIMHLNETVQEMTGRLDEYGEDLYWLSIMGTPSATEPWGWQWDGHHLIINYFVLGDQVVVTPTFLGRGARSCHDRQIRGLESLQSRRRPRLGLGSRTSPMPSAPKPSSRRKPSGEDFTTAFRDNLVLNYQASAMTSFQLPSTTCLLQSG